jgi:CheY-like chemotaxis protein
MTIARILVVDDDPYIVDVVSTSLRLLGEYEVLVATNGSEGLILCSQEHPDALVIDVGMPYMDGFQVVRALRGDPETADIPIIMLTARVLHKDEMTGLMSGADFYLRKPLNPYQLVQAVKEAIAFGQTQREDRIIAMAEWTDRDEGEPK